MEQSQLLLEKPCSRSVSVRSVPSCRAPACGAVPVPPSRGCHRAHRTGDVFSGAFCAFFLYHADQKQTPTAGGDGLLPALLPGPAEGGRPLLGARSAGRGRLLPPQTGLGRAQLRGACRCQGDSRCVLGEITPKTGPGQGWAGLDQQAAAVGLPQGTP